MAQQDILEGLMPGFKLALHKLTDDLCAIRACATAAHEDITRGVDMDIAMDSFQSSLRDICLAADDSLLRVAAIRKVQESMTSGLAARRAFDVLGLKS